MILDSIKSLFNKNSQKKEKEKPTPIYENIIMSDELFVKNFTLKKGKFFYCEDENSVKETIDNILNTNNWEGVFYTNDYFKKLTKHSFKNAKNSDISLLSCESLIANTGEILLSSDQTGGRKISEISKNIVIVANSNQIVHDIIAGMRKINTNKQGSIPSNITTISADKGYINNIFVILIY